MSAATLYTRCPGCQTVFRVSATQLALREGQVRCGHCRAVFDANRERVALDAPRLEDSDEHDELAAGRPTVTLRGPEALQPFEGAAVPAPAEDAKPEAAPDIEEEATQPVEIPIEATPADGVALDAAPAIDIPIEATSPNDVVPIEATPPNGVPIEAMPANDVPARATPDEKGNTEATTLVAEATADAAATRAAESETPIRVVDGPRASRFEWTPRKALRERPTALYGMALAALVAALGAQGLFEFRDALAAHAPFTRPVLEAACGLVGCSVGPLRDAGALYIDASDLRADPAHRGLLKLSATIRNRAPYPIAWPYLELTLTDSSDQVVARRAFAPAEYAGRAGDVPRGIPGSGEEVVGLTLDASATSQSGYRLYLFYP